MNTSRRSYDSPTGGLVSPLAFRTKGCCFDEGTEHPQVQMLGGRARFSEAVCMETVAWPCDFTQMVAGWVSFGPLPWLSLSFHFLQDLFKSVHNEIPFFTAA